MLPSAGSAPAVPTPHPCSALLLADQGDLTGVILAVPTSRMTTTIADPEARRRQPRRRGRRRLWPQSEGRSIRFFCRGKNGHVALPRGHGRYDIAVQCSGPNSPGGRPAPPRRQG
jgi:hypothetical protein